MRNISSAAQAIKRTRTAFTVIEVLLGVSIFALVALAVYHVFWSGVMMSQKAQGQYFLYRQARWALDLIGEETAQLLRYDFTGAYPGKRAFSGTQNEIRFLLGQEDQMRWVRYYLDRPREGKIYQVILGARSRGNRSVTLMHKDIQQAYVLMREEMDFISGVEEEANPEIQQEIVATHIAPEGLRFSFSDGKGASEQGVVWQQDWHAEEFPALIRCELNFLPEASQHEGWSISRDFVIPLGIREMTP